VHAELRLEHDIHVGRKRVERLMRDAGLSGLIHRRRGRTTIRVQGVRTAPDLVARDFNPTSVNHLWCADITYIRTWEGWLYLASVMDCYGRRIVGWAMADHMRAELVVGALEMAVARRGPRARSTSRDSRLFGVRCRGRSYAIAVALSEDHPVVCGDRRARVSQRRPASSTTHDAFVQPASGRGDARVAVLRSLRGELVASPGRSRALRDVWRGYDLHRAACQRRRRPPLSDHRRRRREARHLRSFRALPRRARAGPPRGLSRFRVGTGAPRAPAHSDALLP
jgi:transposase InsO family protein